MTCSDRNGLASAVHKASEELVRERFMLKEIVDKLLSEAATASALR